jgi:anti-sigma factor RsiW
VSCNRPATVLQGYFDDELDAVGVIELENHLQQCEMCSTELGRLKSLRSGFSDAQLYSKSPDRLRRDLLRKMNLPSGVPRATSRFWLVLGAASVALLVALGTWQAVSIRARFSQRSLLVAEVVDAHLRSLQPGHMTDVLSSDQHTVKPWFDGKLDFAPPVKELSAEGFPLQGGRLDVINGRTVAALVYGRRKHVVSVFVWPTSDSDSKPDSGSEQGHQWIGWRRGGMQFFAISDTGASDLADLQQLLSR